MIYVAGDTHGDIDYKKLLALKEENVTFDDFLIICGDMGICWSPELLPYFLSFYRDIGCTIIFVDGNHENFDMLNSYQLVEYKGAIMHQIDDHIFHILRGEIMTLEDKTFLCIGGACSIDKMYRKLHISWWPEEEITSHDINNAICNLEKVNNKVDYVITHCCDSKTVVKAFGFKRDVCTDQLSFIDKIVDYKNWFFGHYHFDRAIGNNKRCLFNTIIQLDDG